MSFSYDAVSRLRVPLCVTGEDGAYLFENQAMRDKLPALCRPAAKLVWEKAGRAVFATLSQEEGCFSACRWKGRDYPYFGFRWERDYGRFFFSALAGAMPLLSEAGISQSAACLAGILREGLKGETGSEVVFRQISDAYFSEAMSVARGSEVTEMACRLLLGTGCLTSEVGAGYVIGEPLRFCFAAGRVLRHLMLDADEGIAPSVILTAERGELVFVLPDTVIPAGGCRVLAVAEHPEAFYFRRETIGAALCLAAAAELTVFDK